MDNFTVGDRCLVHHLESEAGLPLNGQHVTLADAIIEKGRFKCKFDDGSFACIKPCNLQIIHGDRANQKKEKCGEDASSNLNKTEKRIKKEVTTDDDKKETAATSTTTTQPQDEKEEPSTSTHQKKQKKKEEEGEECSICLDLLPINGSKFTRATCCGKGMHIKCRKDMFSSKMSQEQKDRCVMCRTEYPDTTKEGSEESVKRLRNWAKKGKAWAQTMLAQRYREGDGVKKDEKRAVVLYNLASTIFFFYFFIFFLALLIFVHELEGGSKGVNALVAGVVTGALQSIKYRYSRLLQNVVRFSLLPRLRVRTKKIWWHWLEHPIRMDGI